MVSMRMRSFVALLACYYLKALRRVYGIFVAPLLILAQPYGNFLTALLGSTVELTASIWLHPRPFRP